MNNSINKMSTTDDMWWEKLGLAGLIMGLASEGSRILNGLMFTIPLGAGWATREVSLITYLDLLVPGLIILGAIALAWKKPFIGGITIIIVWMLWMILSHVLSLDAIRRIFEAGFGLTTWIIPMVFRLPVLASGLLFILSGRKAQAMLSKRVGKTTVTSSQRQKLCLAGVIVGLMMGIMYMQRAITPDLVFNLAFLGAGLVIFGSVALAWKRPLIGSIVLTIESLWPLALLVASPLFFSSEGLGLAMLWGIMPQIALFMCFPLLVSGILFLLSWREGQKQIHL